MDDSLKNLLNTFGPELAQLDKSFVNRARNDKPFRLNPKTIINESKDAASNINVPLNKESTNPSDSKPLEGSIPSPLEGSIPSSGTQPQPQPNNQDNQMELSFNENDISKIYDLLDGIYLKLEKIEKRLNNV